MPSSEIKMKIAPGAKHLDADCDPFLPLEVFDNTEYDCRKPREWLALGKEPDGQKPVPGKALLPNGIVKEGVRQYEWVDVGMTAYDKKQKLYQVIKSRRYDFELHNASCFTGMGKVFSGTLKNIKVQFHKLQKGNLPERDCPPTVFPVCPVPNSINKLIYCYHILQDMIFALIPF